MVIWYNLIYQTFTYMSFVMYHHRPIVYAGYELAGHTTVCVSVYLLY